MSGNAALLPGLHFYTLPMSSGKPELPKHEIPNRRFGANNELRAGPDLTGLKDSDLALRGGARASYLDRRPSGTGIVSRAGADGTEHA